MSEHSFTMRSTVFRRVNDGETGATEDVKEIGHRLSAPILIPEGMDKDNLGLLFFEGRDEKGRPKPLGRVELKDVLEAMRRHNGS